MRILSYILAGVSISILSAALGLFSGQIRSGLESERESHRLNSMLIMYESAIKGQDVAVGNALIYVGRKETKRILAELSTTYACVQFDGQSRVCQVVRGGLMSDVGPASDIVSLTMIPSKESSECVMTSTWVPANGMVRIEDIVLLPDGVRVTYCAGKDPTTMPVDAERAKKKTYFIEWLPGTSPPAGLLGN